MASLGVDPGDGRPGLLTSVELPDGSAAGGWLVDVPPEWVLRLYVETDLRPGEEMELSDGRRLTVREVSARPLADPPGTDVRVEGRCLSHLENGAGGDEAWPRAAWRSLAKRCRYDGFARPVVRFLGRLGQLRSALQIDRARDAAAGLSAEHLAAATGQVGGELLRLRADGAPGDVVGAVASLYRDLLEEMGERCDRGEFLQPPNPAARIRVGRHQPDAWRTFDAWGDLLP